MTFNYKLAEYSFPYFTFRFDDGRWIHIDLVKDYPNYKLPSYGYACDKWHFTVKKINSKNTNYKIGDIRLFDKKFIKKLGTIVKRIYLDDIEYNKSTQTELDKYESIHVRDSDNGKVYLQIVKEMNEEVCPQNYENQITKIRTINGVKIQVTEI